MALKELPRVQYFNGAWFDEAAERMIVKKALAALWDAVLRCRDELLTESANIRDAAQTARDNCSRPELVDAFMRTFDIADPRIRFQEARLAYHQIFKCLGQMAHPLSSGL